jgi:hypothetical protein
MKNGRFTNGCTSANVFKSVVTRYDFQFFVTWSSIVGTSPNVVVVESSEVEGVSSAGV